MEMIVYGFTSKLSALQVPSPSLPPKPPPPFSSVSPSQSLED